MFGASGDWGRIARIIVYRIYHECTGVAVAPRKIRATLVYIMSTLLTLFCYMRGKYISPFQEPAGEFKDLQLKRCICYKSRSERLDELG